MGINSALKKFNGWFDEFILEAAKPLSLVGFAMGTVDIFNRGALTGWEPFNITWSIVQAGTIDGLFFAVWYRLFNAEWKRENGLTNVSFVLIGLILAVVVVITNSIISMQQLWGITDPLKAMAQLGFNPNVFTEVRAVLVVLVTIMTAFIRNQGISSVTGTGTGKSVTGKNGTVTNKGGTGKNVIVTGTTRNGTVSNKNGTRKSGIVTGILGMAQTFFGRRSVNGKSDTAKSDTGTGGTNNDTSDNDTNDISDSDTVTVTQAGSDSDTSSDTVTQWEELTDLEKRQRVKGLIMSPDGDDMDLTQIAQDTGINKRTMYRWRRDYKQESQPV